MSTSSPLNVTGRQCHQCDEWAVGFHVVNNEWICEKCWDQKIKTAAVGVLGTVAREVHKIEQGCRHLRRILDLEEE